MYRLIRRYQIRDEIIFALISSEAMGHEDKPWFPKDPKERDPDEYWGDDYSTGYNYLLYGGGIFITVILVIMFVKMYVKLWVCCLERNKRQGRVIVQPPPPPPPQPFKPSPPPYTPDDFPPPYHVCVPEDSLPPQSNSTGRPQPTVPGYHTGSSAGNASAPPPKSPPLPEKPHVVHVPAGSRDGY